MDQQRTVTPLILRIRFDFILSYVIQVEAFPLPSDVKTILLFSSDERDAVQKKTFTKWVNSHLSRVSCRISDLYNDLRDGYMLTRLLEVLSGELLVGTHTQSPKSKP